MSGAAPPFPERFVLCRPISAVGEHLSIDGVRVRKLREAMDGVRSVLGFEDRFAMLVDNLLEFEQELLRIGVSQAVRPHHTYDAFFENKRQLNRRLTNLVSTCRQYLDQNHKHIEPLLVGTEVSFAVRTNEEYDKSLAYRAIEMLRNYVQHRDQGIHTFLVDGAWIDSAGKNDRKLRCRAATLLDLDHLQNSGGLKKKELDIVSDLRAGPHQPDVALLLREYVSGLAQVHKSVREALDSKVKDWKFSIQEAVSDYQSAFADKKAYGLIVARQNDDATRTKVLEVFEEPAQRLADLQRLNFCPSNLGKMYASSEFVPQPWKR